MTDPMRDKSLTASDLARSKTLRTYLTSLRQWHGYIRFLGLPDRRDNPDVLIDRLFVEPLVAKRPVSPDEDPAKWLSEAETIFDALRLGTAVVLLGDPGTGKSTLLNYLVWLLARPTGATWSKRLGPWLLPVPMLLRELRFGAVGGCDGLLDAFLDHPVGRPLRRGRYFANMLERGKILFLLDGVDEVTSAKARKVLRRAMFDGILRYPGCRWLVSSRIVGYDEVPFDATPESGEGRGGAEALISDADDRLGSQKTEQWIQDDVFVVERERRRMDDEFVVRRYLVPFDDERIEAFAHNWYAHREAAATKAGSEAAHLVRAVHADEAILRLARVPNLLTLMALIHRIEATLPHGRALLYERIAEAYLESIDKFRGVYSGAYRLAQKKRWLARVAYEMQRRRSVVDDGDRKGGEGELLAEVGDVVGWIGEEMERAGGTDEMSVQEFINIVGRRSGLFLPRGEGRYAFVHLSFQEYFAAVALEKEVTSLSWARETPTALGVRREALAAWGQQGAWRETLAFLFELLADKEDWHSDVLDAVFGGDFSRIDEMATEATLTRAELLARLVVNSRAGIERKQDRVLAAVVGVALRGQRIEVQERGPARVFGSLLGDDAAWNGRVLNEVARQMVDDGTGHLSLGQTKVKELRPLSRVPQMKTLDLAQTEVEDLTPLEVLTSLEVLDVARTNVVDLKPLARLAALRHLDLYGTAVTDVQPLTRLTGLCYLHIGHTRVADVGGLLGLSNLETLYVGRTQVEDLGPLAGLRALQRLSVAVTRVADLKPVAGLTELKHLYLGGTRIDDIGPLSGLRQLRRLAVWETQVEDLAPLEHLRGLRILEAEGTPVANLKPLASLRKLEAVDVARTPVSDLRPLQNATELKQLHCGGTKVVDVGPLAELRKLRVLRLQQTEVMDVAPLSGLTELEYVDLRDTGVGSAMARALRNKLPRCRVLA